MPTLPTLEDIYKLSNSWRRKMKKKNLLPFLGVPAIPTVSPAWCAAANEGWGKLKRGPTFPISISICFCRIFTHFWVKIWLYRLAIRLMLDWHVFQEKQLEWKSKIRKANTVWLIGCQESNKVKVAQGKVGWNRGWWWPTNVTTKETSIWLFRMQVSFLDVAMSRLERVEKRWTGMADVAIFGCQPCWAARDKEKLSQLNLWTNTNKNTEIIFIFCATVAFKGEQL